MPAAVAASRARVWNRSPVARSTPREPFRTTAGGARSKRASGSAVVRRRRPVATSSGMPRRSSSSTAASAVVDVVVEVPQRAVEVGDDELDQLAQAGVTPEEGGGGRDAVAGDGGGVDGGDRGRQVEVVVEGGSHLVERGVARPRRPPRRQALGAGMRESSHSHDVR